MRGEAPSSIFEHIASTFEVPGFLPLPAGQITLSLTLSISAAVFEWSYGRVRRTRLPIT
jgi:hypothetical protein